MNKYKFFDLIRKIVFVLLREFSSFIIFYGKAVFYFYTKCWPTHIGSNILHRNVANSVNIGTSSAFYSNVVFEIGEDANLSIGNNFTFSYGSILVCNEAIRIGNNVMIGEYPSLRHPTHEYHEKEIPFCKQRDFSKPIILGDNIWIGRGCIVMPGTTIENNVIVGANSIVKGHLYSNFIYAGSPVRKIRSIIG